MHWQSFYVHPGDVKGETITFKNEEAKHLHVLRKKPGDKVWAVDGEGSSYDVEIVSVNKSTVTARIWQSRRMLNEPTVQITLALGLIKGDRFDWLVEKATELGVNHIIPLVTEKTVVKPSAAKTNRWKRIALSAMKQSGRACLPEISEGKTFRQILTYSAGFKECYIAEKTEDSISFSSIVERKRNTSQKILMLIGPEGGFTETEIDEAREYGFEIVHFGDRRLRAETAGLLSLSLLLYESEEFN